MLEIMWLWGVVIIFPYTWMVSELELIISIVLTSIKIPYQYHFQCYNSYDYPKFIIRIDDGFAAIGLQVWSTSMT